MNKEILVKYLNDKCSDNEFEQLVRWLKKDGLSEESKDWGLEDWKTFEPDISSYDKSTYDTLLDRIHHKINLQSQPKIIPIRNKFSDLTIRMSRIAAVLFIPLLGFTFFLLASKIQNASEQISQNVELIEIVTPLGSRSSIQLSDGTNVNLNHGSKIMYPRNFSGDERTVTLVGEAYFDVAHNPEKPFIVKTEHLNVKALGTQFNVEAYSDDDAIATTLIEGKVVIEKLSSEGKVQTIGTMVPGQHVEYNVKSGEVKSSKGEYYKYIAWKDGRLVFDNEPITDVAEQLNRMFNVDIEISDEVKKYTYTVTFENDRLFHILDLMTKVTPVSYTAYPRQKLENGSFAKQRIKIEKRQ